MENEQQIVDYLKTIYDSYKPLAIIIGGSSCIEFIDSPNDLDVLIITTALPDGGTYSFAANQKELAKMHELGVYPNICIVPEDWLFSNLMAYPYETGPYLKKYFDEDNKIDLSEYDMFDNKGFRLGVLKKLYACVQFESGRVKPLLLQKPYRLLMTCYQLHNGSYELTDTQKKNVNKAHDDRQLSEYQTT